MAAVPSGIVIENGDGQRCFPPPGAGSGGWSTRQPDLAPPQLLFPGSWTGFLVREAQPPVKGLRALQEAAPQHMRVTRVTHRRQQGLLGYAQARHVPSRRHRAHPALQRVLVRQVGLERSASHHPAEREEEGGRERRKSVSINRLRTTVL